jgi:peroxiredoxin
VNGYVLVFGILLPWLLIAFGCWLGYQLIRQNGRILLRLEALEERLSASRKEQAPAPTGPSGLPIGSTAPEFELPDLSGERKALSDFPGKRLLLIFFNPQCGFCTRMAPDLAALPWDGTGGRPVPLLVTTGDVNENRQLVEEHKIRGPVLLQEKMEVASAYRTGGTPMGYLIDEEGRIASALAVGSDALLALAEAPGATAASVNGGRYSVRKGNRTLADSHINRSGLKAGTPAPDFTLPRLGGGELSLAEYRGRRVLLVFSAPTCGPCDLLAPRLEQLARRTPDVQVLMVSRGEEAANRAKVAQHGLTFPVALQRQWEISRLYEMFSTPIGYLIDAKGLIAADVAVGVEPILSLLSGSTAPTNGKAPTRGKGAMPLRR